MVGRGAAARTSLSFIFLLFISCLYVTIFRLIACFQCYWRCGRLATSAGGRVVSVLVLRHIQSVVHRLSSMQLMCGL